VYRALLYMALYQITNFRVQLRSQREFCGAVSKFPFKKNPWYPSTWDVSSLFILRRAPANLPSAHAGRFKPTRTSPGVCRGTLFPWSTTWSTTPVFTVSQISSRSPVAVRFVYFVVLLESLSMSLRIELFVEN